MIHSLSVALLAAAPLSWAQTSPQAEASQSAPEPTPYTLSAHAQLVVLDVVVTDAKGRIINGLGKDDFLVTEDKEPQTVKNFESPRAHDAPPDQPIHSTADLDRIAPQSPISIIVLDEVTTRFEDEAFARYSLKKYLNTQSDTLTQPTMLVSVDLRHFNVLRDYTTSKKEILDALDHHFAEMPWHLGQMGRSGGAWAGQMFTQSFNALVEVAQATSGHPGHKNMVWIGRGFPAVNMANLVAEDAASLQHAIQICTNMLRDARVTLYTVDPAGVSAAPPDQDENGFDVDPFGGQVDFNTMATATGGHAFYGRNDVDAMIGTSVRDGVEFYTLSYTPAKPVDDPKAFRRIRVTMKNPAYKATTREGYFPESAPPTAMVNGKASNRMVYDLATALHNQMVYDGVPLDVTRKLEDLDTFNVLIDSSAVPWERHEGKPFTAELALVVATFDRKGIMITQNAHNLIVRTPAEEGDTPKARSLAVNVTIKTDAPAARVRIVVRLAANGKMGAQNVSLLPPKK